MTLKEEVLELEKEVKEIQEESLAMSLLKDYKRQSKRQFIIILVILIMWFATIGYLIYILNDTQVQILYGTSLLNFNLNL